MADISKIKIPSGDVYDLKDDTARGLLENKIGFDQPVQIGQTEFSMILYNDGNDGVWLTVDNGVEDEDSYQLISKQGVIQIPKRQEIPTVPNSFGTVKVGTTNLVADAQSDTLTVTAGNNITLTPNATNDSFSIAATDTTYDAATAAPLMNGTATVGSSIKYARQDHVHPSDTSKVNKAGGTLSDGYLRYGIGSNDDGTQWPNAWIGPGGSASAGTKNMVLWYKPDANTDAVYRVLVTSTGDINIPPKQHASSSDEYGIGNMTKYGHVKLINNLTSSAYTAGEALSAYQGKVLKDAIDNSASKYNSVLHNPQFYWPAHTNVDTGGYPRIELRGSQQSDANSLQLIYRISSSSYSGWDLVSSDGVMLPNKADTNHASTATTYGLGDTTHYGHVKLANNLTTSSNTDGLALSAYQGKVLKDSIDNKIDTTGGTGYGTAIKWGIGSNTKNAATSSDFPRAELRFAGTSASGTGNVSIYTYTDNASTVHTNQSLVTSSGNINIVQKYKPALYFPIGSNDDGQDYPRVAIASSGTASGGTNNVYISYKASSSEAAVGQTIVNSNGEINIPPKNHASATSAYGVGAIGQYGHVQLIDSLTSSTYTQGEALSAHQGKVLKDAIDEKLAQGDSYTPAQTTKSFQGLTVTFVRSAGTVHVTIRGTLTAAINSSSAYVTICAIPSGYRLSSKEYALWYNILGATIYGQIRISSNNLQIGYTRLINGASSTNIAENTALYARISYACDTI